VEPAGVTVVQDDAMTLDWSALLADAASWVLVANLPYNVATPLVADLLDSVPAITRMLVMVQKEAGERLAATPGSSAYGAVSVKVAQWAQASVAGRVPRSVFLPEPKVDSVLVSIARRHVGAARRAVRCRAGRVRPAPQDAAPVAGGRGVPRVLRGCRCAARGAAGGARRARVGQAGGVRHVERAPAKLTLS